jgi:hypothetical protein
LTSVDQLGLMRGRLRLTTSYTTPRDLTRAETGEPEQVTVTVTRKRFLRMDSRAEVPNLLVTTS